VGWKPPVKRAVQRARGNVTMSALILEEIVTTLQISSNITSLTDHITSETNRFLDNCCSQLPESVSAYVVLINFEHAKHYPQNIDDKCIHHHSKRQVILGILL
jgi:hypothetical protein